MGEVYRAEDLELGEAVALKFLPEEVAHDERQLDLLLAEVRMARKVSHPNVCRVHDVVVHRTEGGGRLHFLSMEYIAGEDLASLLRRIGRLPKVKALEISLELCAGLSAVHGSGLLHRDIKPANVMIDRAGRVRLTDFGLAIPGQRQGLQGGTPAYMAPEQHSAGLCTERTDVYSLGLVLYEIFTGQRAFDGRSPREYSSLHRSHPPTPPSEHFRNLDPQVERILLDCLEKAPERRTARVESLAEALAEVDPDSSSVSQPIESWHQPTPTDEPSDRKGNISVVLLYAHLEDQPLVAGVRRFLQERGLRTEELGNDPLQPVWLRRTALERASALLIFHGEVEGRWVEARLNEAVKIVTQERRPFVFSVFVGAPAGKNLADYDSFRFYNFHLLDHQEGFQSQAFEPLLASLGQTSAVPTPLPQCPFIGLRSFGREESSLFHGREAQVQDLLEQLQRTRFVAVLGNSGCGKSSLVRAGLIPALEAGWLVAERDRWQVATLRPGAHPLESLVSALATLQPRDPRLSDPPILASRLLEEGVPPLLEALEPTLGDDRTNLLLLVDQFEEIFRFGLRGDAVHRREAEALVARLLELTQAPHPIYVILTLRSDFLGDCDQLEGLPEALNHNQYLVPRLSRRQRREAIEGPVRLYGRRVEPELVARLLDEVGEASDQLPLMQHALMRIWGQVAGEERLGLRRYTEIGTLDKALSNHADEAFSSLAEEDQRLAEWVFRALTEIDPEGRRIRRSRTVAQLVAETGGDRRAIERVVLAFRRPDRAFLMPPEPIALGEQSLIDISHESLIRQWDRLRQWVDLEGQAAGVYRKLVERGAAFARDGRNPLVERDLEEAVEWSEEVRPGESWLERYGGDSQAVADYIAESQRLDAQRRHEEVRRGEDLEEARQREEQALRDRAQQARRWSWVLAGAALVALALASWAMIQRREARLQSQAAKRQTLEANYNLAMMLDERAATATTAARAGGRAEDYSKAWLYSLAAMRQPIGDRRLPSALGKLLEPDLRGRAFGEVWRSPRPPGVVVSVAFSPDGRYLASGSSARRIRLWDLETGQNVAILEGHSARIQGLAFSPDGRLLASGSDDRSIRLWDLDRVEDGSLLGIATLEGDAPIWHVAFSADGRRLASRSADHAIRIWDLETKQSVAIHEGRSLIVRSVALSPDGRQIAFGSDRTIQVRDLESGQILTTLEEPSEWVLENSDWVWDLVFSPDGRRLASASTDASIRIWDLDSGQILATLEGHTDLVRSMVFSSDGRRLASGSADKTVRVWDFATGSSAATLVGHSAIVRSVAFGPEGRRLAFGSEDRRIRIWDLETGRSLASFAGHSGRARSAAFSPDGRRLASGSVDRTIQLWDPGTGQNVATFEGHTAPVAGVAFSPDGRLLASGSKDRSIRVWDVGTGQSLATLEDLTAPVSSVAFGPEGRRLASGSDDSKIRLWNLDAAQDTTQSVALLEGHTAAVRTVAVSPDGRYLASGSDDQTVRLWGLEAVESGILQSVAILRGHTAAVRSVAFSDDRHLASGSDDQTIQLWDLDAVEQGTLQSVAILRGHTAAVRSVAFDSDGQRLASGSDDRTIRLWDTDPETKGSVRGVSILEGHAAAVSSVSFSPDGYRLASTSDDQSTRIWNLETAQRVTTLEGPSAGSSSVAFSPEGRYLVSGSVDSTIRIWDLEEGQSVATLEGHGAPVLDVAFSPDGRRLASGSSDQTIRLWDFDTGKSTAVLEGHLHRVFSVAFSPDGRRLASSSNDQTIRVWDLDTGQSLSVFDSQSVMDVAFSPDGRRLASASIARGVGIWDLETGKSLATLEGHSGLVFSVAFSPDGRRLASGSSDQTIRLWDLDTEGLPSEGPQNSVSLEGHSAVVASVTFSPDGRYLASASGDRTVRIWDLATGQTLATLEGHAALVSSVSFSPDGRRLASSSVDSTIRLWVGSFPESLADPRTRKAALDRVYRSSLRVLGYRPQGLDFEPAPERVHLSPINGYRFPETFEVPAIDRPRPPGQDFLEWLLEVGEESPAQDGSSALDR